MEQQAKALEQQVKAGKLTRAEADRVQAATRQFTDPATLKILGSMAAVLFGVARVFWWAFILWLLGRLFLKVRFGYLKALEVAGLALMISVLGGVVTLLLTVNLAKLFATPSLALVVSRLRRNPQEPSAAGRRQRLFLLAGRRALRRPGQARRGAVPPCRVVRIRRLGHPGILLHSPGRSAGAIRLLSGAPADNLTRIPAVAVVGVAALIRPSPTFLWLAFIARPGSLIAGL